MSGSITTKRGDGGKTTLYSGESIMKCDPKIHCLGMIDDVVAKLGVVRSHDINLESDFRADIEQLQRWMFIVGSDIATEGDKRYFIQQVDQKMMDALDRMRDKYEGLVGPLRGFVLPGEDICGAHLDVTRAAVRTLERWIQGLDNVKRLDNKLLLQWVNRLSDLLFLMAREADGDLKYVIS